VIELLMGLAVAIPGGAIVGIVVGKIIDRRG